MLCICLKSGQFAITAVLLVATRGHKQCWQRPAASLENHRGRNRNYINRYYIYIHNSQCIFVEVLTMHYHGIPLCNTRLSSIYEHKVYSKITLCKSKAMLWRVFFFFSSCFSFFAEINGFTILNVEHSDHYIDVWSLHLDLGLTVLPEVWSRAQHTNTTGLDFRSQRLFFSLNKLPIVVEFYKHGVGSL